MSNPANEAFGQARQGSVAAIIQVLNERLSDAGIRTRAVVADGILQLLCEAQSTEQLEQRAVVSRVRQILENISPQRISKVKINSRLVKEEQLLWLEEINRDPDNALLWSETITLKRPFFIKRWIRDRHLKPAAPVIRDISEPSPTQGSLSKKVLGGLGLVLLVLATGWLFREDLSQVGQPEDSEVIAGAETDLPPLPDQSNNSADSPASQSGSDQSEATQSDTPANNSDSSAGDRTANTTPETPPPSEPVASAPQTNTPAATDAPPNTTGATADAFAEAVRIANQAATDGQKASTVAEWLDLASRWQRASDLMAQIPEGNEQYTAARERVTSYAQNSEMALAQAAALQ